MACWVFPKHSVDPHRAGRVLIARLRTHVTIWVGAMVVGSFASQRVQGHEFYGLFLDLWISIGIVGFIGLLLWLWKREQVLKSVRTTIREGGFHVEEATVEDGNLVWKDAFGGLNEAILSPSGVTYGDGLLLIWWKHQHRMSLSSIQVILDTATLPDDQSKSQLLAHFRKLRALS